MEAGLPEPIQRLVNLLEQPTRSRLTKRNPAIGGHMARYGGVFRAPGGSRTPDQEILAGVISLGIVYRATVEIRSDEWIIPSNIVSIHALKYRCFCWVNVGRLLFSTNRLRTTSPGRPSVDRHWCSSDAPSARQSPYRRFHTSLRFSQHSLRKELPDTATSNNHVPASCWVERGTECRRPHNRPECTLR